MVDYANCNKSGKGRSPIDDLEKAKVGADWDMMYIQLVQYHTELNRIVVAHWY